MELKLLSEQLTMCQVNRIEDIPFSDDIYFISNTEDEISPVCKTDSVPARTVDREDGWRGLKIQGMPDFSLIGILSKLSTVSAENEVGIFAVSTYNTDCILVRENQLIKAVDTLQNAGYRIV